VSLLGHIPRRLCVVEWTRGAPRALRSGSIPRPRTSLGEGGEKDLDGR
jgi:hypothetical protein